MGLLSPEQSEAESQPYDEQALESLIDFLKMNRSSGFAYQAYCYIPFLAYWLVPVNWGKKTLVYRRKTDRPPRQGIGWCKT
jgi:hypothetical protein